MKAGVDSQTYTDSNQNTQGKRISLAKLLMFRESCGSFESKGIAWADGWLSQHDGGLADL